MYEIEVRSAFEAAHRLPGYDGKCARLHGHNWEVVVVVRGYELDGIGMLVDFKVVKAELKKVLDEFDHRLLNDLKAFSEENPTAENIARKIYQRLAASEIFSDSVKLHAVRVLESPTSRVTYYE